MPPLPLDCSSEFAAFEVRQATALDCKRRHPTLPPSTLPLIPIGDACPHRTPCRCLQLLSGASIGPRTALPSFARDREPRTAANIKSRTAAPTVFAIDREPHVITMDTLIRLVVSELVEKPKPQL
jgi:hypothetical protein